jgi:PAS domain-containing protein
MNTKFQLQLHEMSCVVECPKVISTDYLLKVYNLIPIPILEIDENQHITQMNPKACEMYTKDIMNKRLKDTNVISKQIIDNMVFC